MHLQSSQVQHIQRVLDLITSFACGRYDLCGIEDLARIAMGLGDPDLSFKALGMVWEDPTAIDDLLATKPKNVSASDLRVIESFKDCLWGPKVLVGFDASGRALFSVGDQTVAVVGLSQEISDLVVGPFPKVLQIALLPFEGVVTYAESFAEFNVAFGPAMQKAIEDEAAAACAREPIATAAAFREFARREKTRLEAEDERRFADQIRRERWDEEGNEPLPPEVRRGVLAGLSEKERSERLAAEDAELARKFRKQLAKELRRSAAKGEPARDTTAALAALPKDDLESLARRLGAKGLSKLNKSQIAARVEPLLGDARELLSADLVSCDGLQLKTLLALAQDPEHVIRFSDEEVLRNGLEHHELLPWTRMYRTDGGFSVSLPGYTREALEGIDLDHVREERDFYDKVYHLVDVLVEFCGVVKLQDFADRFRSFYATDRSDPEIFEKLTGIVRDYGEESPFEFWRPQPAGDDSRRESEEPEALIHGELADDAVVRDMARSCAIEQLAKGPAPDAESPMGDSSREKFLESCRKALARRDEQVRSLIKEHEDKAGHGPFPLAPELAEMDPFAWKMRLPEVVSLRNWLDAHVPEGEDELSFADGCVAEILGAQVGAKMPTELVRAADDMDLFLLSEDPESLVGRIMAVWSALPSWDNNGWSPDALHAKVTGRRVFRNPDGSERKVGRNEPCPCGSGKKYKKCCGR